MTPFHLHYKKIKHIDLSSLAKTHVSSADDIKYEYNPFHIDALQNYNPMYSVFFELTEQNCNQITFNHKYHMETDHVPELYHDRGFHMKYSPLLDPLHYLIGKYTYDDPAIRKLPSLSNQKECLPKLVSVHNVSYVDAFYSYLSSQLLHHHGMTNALDYYGSYLGVQKVYKATITDDFEYLYSSPKFMENLGKEFHVTSSNEWNEYSNMGSRANKHKIQIGSAHSSLDIIELESDAVEEMPETVAEEEMVYEKSPAAGSAKSYASTSSSLNSNDLNYSSEEEDPSDQEESDSEIDNDSDSGSGSGSGSGSEEEVYAYIKNFPVQMISLEKCDGTLDQLFVEDEVNKEKGAAYLMQIIFTLLIYQKAFHFTHNDLHTNNIMYIHTETEFLYYKYADKIYRVPTYGKIFKIIDFGRAIYRFQDKVFCSDSFAPGGDAHSQYNCEPFCNETRPRIDPNMSFDLCRLGCSIYDFLIEDERDFRDELQETIWRWCQDDNGKNILYKKTGEERYPNFKLYKMIARNVHKHTPEAQLETPFFSKFRMNAKKYAKLSPEQELMDLDTLPVYYSLDPTETISV